MNTQANDTVRVLADNDLDRYLDGLDVMSILEQAFRALKQGEAVQPPQTLALFPSDKGDFITYLGILGNFEVFGAKLSPYIPTGGAPVVTAWTMLMSMRTGKPLLVCDSGRLTRERTAATTALAVNKLAPAGAKKLSLVGTGAMGKAHLRHVLKLRDWSEIRVYSLDLVASAALRDEFKAMDARVVCCDNTRDCVNGADVVMLCTSSGTPILDIKDIGKPALVTSISTNVALAREVDPQALAEMDVYCDYKKTTPASAGEMVLAEREHGWSPDAIKGDLADICTDGFAAPDYARPVFFRSIGLGLEDVAIAYAVYTRL